LSSADIYKEIILDYYKNPRNYGRLENFDSSYRDSNPLCGDEIEMQVKFDGTRISEIKFVGKGCAISQASASMLTELAKGKDIEWVKKLSKEDILKMLGNPDLGPSRIKCALLGMKVLKEAVYSYAGSKIES
jgi:nitrogen fixation NifU-like protein